jgi:mycoredoxin
LTGATHTVKMFTTTWCAFCKNTKRYLDSKGISYEEIDIEQHPEYGEAIEKASGGFRTVPTLDIDGKLYVNPSRQEMDAVLGA